MTHFKQVKETMYKLIQTSIALFALTFAQVSPAASIEAPNLAVKSYVLKDFNSGSTIASNKPDSRVEPASLTKVMTAYLIFEALQKGQLKLNQTIPVSTKAWKVEGSKMFIEPNKPVTVDELLHGLIIQSGNDAATALAEALGGSEEQFATMMNNKATSLGMKNTHYVNATGLPDPQHYTTANDLATLASTLIRDFPADYKRLYSVKAYTYNKITQANRNRLLWLDPNVDGMKTGHTNSAGYCLIASSNRDNSRLVSVILGADSVNARSIESQKLLNFGSQFFESSLVYKKNQTISEVPVWKGDRKTVAATVNKDLYFSLPKGDYARVKANMISQEPLIAPIKANQVIGKIVFSLDGKIIAETKVIAAKEVAIGGIFSRMIDSIRLMLK
jgi:D-alanyl-D-alanine carboxypeptidase (penicillin-binding protein 5/6)